MKIKIKESIVSAIPKNTCLGSINFDCQYIFIMMPLISFFVPIGLQQFL